LDAVSKIITPSQSEKDDLVNFYNTDSNKIEVINRGVNEVFFGNPKHKLQNPLRLIVVSTIKEQKNVIESVRILKRLRDFDHDAQLTIIGKIESNSLYNDILNYIESNDLSDNTILIQGVQQIELAIEMKKSDILILPSLWETFGRVVYEGFSSGLPVVLRKEIDCFSNLYKEDFVFPYSTIDEAVFSIIKLSKESEKYHALSLKAIKFATQFSSLIERKRLKEVILCKD